MANENENKILKILNKVLCSQQLLGIHVDTPRLEDPDRYYTKKHRGGCTRGTLRPGPLITNRAQSVRLVIEG